MSRDARVVFLPSGKRGSFAIGTAVLDAARQLGVDIDSVCGGRALCGRCQVLCVEGSFPKHNIVSEPGHLSPFSETEQAYEARRRSSLAVGRRLSCQARLLGDVVVDVPAESQVHRQLVRKKAEHRVITLDTNTHLYFVEVLPADLYNQKGDLERLRDALAAQWKLENLTLDSSVLPYLQAALRKENWSVTVAIRGHREIAAVWPGFREQIYGAAVDIGSTTIAVHLCDLISGELLGSGGVMNPQIRFGEDLMSRVSHIMMHPESVTALTEVVQQGVNELIASVAREKSVDVNDILELVVVGNPIMHHLFLGINPIELGGAPFALATEGGLNVLARELNLQVNRGAIVYLLPSVAGHVGADSAGVMLAEEPYLRDEMTLVVDVGTNAEIVLGNKNRLLACSSPTGPAFEGAQISAGQRAAPGAIERVRIDPETLAVRIQVIGSTLWSDETGFAESIRHCGITGICGSGIIEAVAEMYLAGVLASDGVIDGSLAAKSDRLVQDGRTWSFRLYSGAQEIFVTQNDVRQIQLAKAALYAGVKLLMSRAGIQKVDAIRLAGAFGSHIDAKYAMAIGLIPDCKLDKVSSAGNAAGTGARIALLNMAARSEIETIVRRVEKIETAVEPQFQQFFVEAMAFPHSVDAFPELFAVIRKPDAKNPAAVMSDGRPRRRRQRQ
jgi:uncharacterized 2Fe-2S/4Fe-4S cluster protein (DUF4445 family)